MSEVIATDLSNTDWAALVADLKTATCVCVRRRSA